MDNLFRWFSHRDRGSTGPQSVSPNNPHIHNPSTQAAQGATPSIRVGWSSSPSPSGSTQGQGHSRPGNPPHLDSLPHRDDRSFPGGFREQGNFTLASAGNQPITRTNSVSHALQGVLSSPSVERDEALDWFTAIDQDNNGELSYEELYSALLTNDNRPFSATTVKYLMGIFDRDGSGVITFDDFGPLWNYLNDGQKMFDSFDADRDGRIGTPELGRALAHYGIHLAPYIVDTIMKKYDKAPSRIWQAGHGVPAQMDRDHFILVCAVVRRICDLYEKYIAGGQTQLSRDDFLRAVIPLP